jgi:hypothetical protein
MRAPKEPSGAAVRPSCAGTRPSRAAISDMLAIIEIGIWGDDGYGYAYLPPGFADGDYAPQEIVVPVAYPIYVGPRCVHSVETVIVPAELGGERRIRITRC